MENVKKLVVKKLKGIIPDSLWDFFKVHKCMLVGGSLTSIITNKEINDLDIYFKDEESFHYALLDVGRLKPDEPLNSINDAHTKVDDDFDLGYQYLGSHDLIFICNTDKSLTFKAKNVYINSELMKVQFIHQNFYPELSNVFDDFDFTINMIGYDFELDQIVLHKDALLHLAQRQLFTNNGTKFPLISVLRVNKYLDRGYKISKREMTKLLLQVAKLEINSYEDVGKHVGGLYGELDVTKLFDTTKPFSIDEVLEQLSELDLDDISQAPIEAKNFDVALKELIVGDYLNLIPYLRCCKNVDGKLISNHDSNYTFELGKIHHPNNPEIPSSGIYCTKGFPSNYYGNVILEVEPVNPLENKGKLKDFGYKEGVLVKQILPSMKKEEYYKWLEVSKGIPVNTLQKMKLLKCV